MTKKIIGIIIAIATIAVIVFAAIRNREYSSMLDRTAPPEAPVSVPGNESAPPLTDSLPGPASVTMPD